MPRAGYKPPNTTAAYIYIPDSLHKAASEHVRHVKRAGVPGYSLQQFVVEAIEEKVQRVNQRKESARMTKTRSEKVSEAWEGYVGSQTPAEFVQLSREMGHETVEAAVAAYVADLPNMFPGEYDPKTVDTEELEGLLAEYIQKYTPGKP